MVAASKLCVDIILKARCEYYAILFSPLDGTKAGLPDFQLRRDSLFLLGVETTDIVRPVHFRIELRMEIDHKYQNVVHPLRLQLKRRALLAGRSAFR